MTEVTYQQQQQHASLPMGKGKTQRCCSDLPNSFCKCRCFPSPSCFFLLFVLSLFPLPHLSFPFTFPLLPLFPLPLPLSLLSFFLSLLPFFFCFFSLKKKLFPLFYNRKLCSIKLRFLSKENSRARPARLSVQGAGWGGVGGRAGRLGMPW